MLTRSDFTKDKRPSVRLRPDFVASGITDIDFAQLKHLGIKACLIDLDGTVVERRSYDVPADIRKCLQDSGLAVYIATNRPKSRDLKNLKQDLGASGVIHPVGIFGKPSKQYYKAALRSHGLKPLETVMIGDRLINDILGANRAGIYSLLVEKFGPSFGFIDSILSRIEVARGKHYARIYGK